jgi:predicted DCC family thiol-disulfide oxidoreductase YuxK
MHPKRGKLIFDDKCEFCIRSIRLLQKLDWFSTIDFIPLGKAAQLMSKYSITAEAMQAKVHHITPSGHVTAGAEAFRKFGKKIPLLFVSAIILHIPLALRLASFLYMKIAMNRYAISRLMKCSSNNCSIHRDH